MSRTSNDVTLVCYDVTSNKLRSKIDKAMKDFGIRLQYSIFLCRLGAEDVRRLREKLMKILERFADERSSGDSVIIIERVGVGRIDCLVGGERVRDAPNCEIF
ncbi:hypothetical protein FACS1894127_7620 [Clostridia bacterium]|nr:hypothetical protein FACS1894127_7620 [Clostridia bacterium]